MLTRLAQTLRSRSARTWVKAACVTLIAAAVVSNAVAYLGFLSFRADLPAAFAPEPTGGTVEVAWSFPFQESRCQVRIGIDTAEIAAAERVNTRAIFGSRDWLRRLYVSAVVAEQARSPMIDRLAGEFRRIRNERGLDSDEYLELLTAGIQAIPYGDIERDTLLAPEVLAGNSGICTDKSLLLGSLLVHEGYDTVLWVFSTQRHVAIGVASDDAQFQGSGYTFIETTAPGYVGQAAAEYRAAGPVARPPARIALGGSIPYTSGDEVEVVLGELRRLETLASASEGYGSLSMNSARHSDRYAARAMEYWIANTTAAYILSNTHDRPGVYSIVAGL